MTKLTEWITAALLIIGPWLAVVLHWFENSFTRENYTFIFFLPLLLVALFGVVSVSIIAYRVYTFNDCEEAAKELQQQILQAKIDLTRRGMKFEEKSS